jgi:tRNA(Ile)-lysidine synthase
LLAHDGLQLPLQVRNWQPGDRFWPAGSKQAEKLKRLFQQRHIPAEARCAWPVVLSAGTIVWVRGFPVATGHQVRDNDAVLIEIVDRGETRLD